ncbi:hypothetical protein PGT21_012315 [Puccinia graminis f. sp. tritici]|uniref:Uncharacterized protein n=1 Tax=Puccinia graminis f. sp. tritici TaxID=56615 RepID=A0A5B0R246_PUCGR|nr:hypothetical protein PGT21_012315 [Puccinia graminis f. sp. tritici]
MEEDTLYGTNLSKGVHTEKLLASCKETPVHQDRSNIWNDFSLLWICQKKFLNLPRMSSSLKRFAFLD